MNYSEEAYDKMLKDLFVRFPSFQNVGSSAYKPGLDNMMFFDSLAGHPHRKYRTIHIAGTNGKGSVANMLASVLAACGLRTGLYTSPHISDFRERMRIIDGRKGADTAELITAEEVWDFVQQWNSTFDHLNLSFFEITTMMAFDWFAKREVDIAVIETGLGGRLDSTNIISPVLDIITNIGLDHCAMLGNTLPEIAFEKAGIIKPHTPVVIGESNPETSPVFEQKVLYSNLPEADYMGDRNKIMSLLTFADKTVPPLWDRSRNILEKMDLKGSYQEKNLRTVLTALDVLKGVLKDVPKGVLTDIPETGGYLLPAEKIEDAIIHTAARMGFRGRWERISDDPVIIADIGHNAHGLKYNFAQLEKMKAEGKCSSLLMVYGMVADKDIDAVMRLMPHDAEYFFTNSSGKRALPADEMKRKYEDFCGEHGLPHGFVQSYGSVAEAVAAAMKRYSELTANDVSCPEKGSRALPLIYVGGSAFVVAEAIEALNKPLKR